MKSSNTVSDITPVVCHVPFVVCCVLTLCAHIHSPAARPKPAWVDAAGRLLHGTKTSSSWCKGHGPMFKTKKGCVAVHSLFGRDHLRRAVVSCIISIFHTKDDSAVECCSRRETSQLAGFHKDFMSLDGKRNLVSLVYVTYMHIISLISLLMLYH